MNIISQYINIMDKERKIAARGAGWCPILNADEAQKTATRLIEVVANSFVKRGYNEKYHVSGYAVMAESVGAHTNLMSDIMRKYLRYEYTDANETDDGYDFLTVLEAAGRHDLPENKTGDIPDDGNRDEAAKRDAEYQYLYWYSGLGPSRDSVFEKDVSRLLHEMEEKCSVTGRALYMADKISALIVTLYLSSCDDLSTPYITLDSPSITARDFEEMEIIRQADGNMNPRRHFKASEMWAVDYFISREIEQYDDSGFFTAIVVMITLLLNNNEWYQWRNP